MSAPLNIGKVTLDYPAPQKGWFDQGGGQAGGTWHPIIPEDGPRGPQGPQGPPGPVRDKVRFSVFHADGHPAPANGDHVMTQNWVMDPSNPEHCLEVGRNIPGSESPEVLVAPLAGILLIQASVHFGSGPVRGPNDPANRAALVFWVAGAPLVWDNQYPTKIAQENWGQYSPSDLALSCVQTVTPGARFTVSVELNMQGGPYPWHTRLRAAYLA